MLNFIKNHYEKIILTLLLLVFVVLLALQLSMLLAGRKISDDELSVKKRNPDHTRLNFKDAKYNAVMGISAIKNWEPLVPRVQGAPYSTDFVTPFPIARCPWCRHYIPSSDFAARKCSYCQHALVPAPTKIVIDDGDADKDGFSNSEERNANPPTDTNDPKSHPSFASKLSVDGISHKKLGLRIKSINAKADDKSKWTVQVDITEGGKPRTRFVTFAKDTVKSDDGEYKLLDVMPDYKEELDPSVKRKLEKNYSTAIFQRVGSTDKITAEINKDIVEGKEKVTIYNELTKTSSDHYIGDIITIGDERSGIEKFVLVSCNSQDGSAVVKPEGKPNDKGVEIYKRKVNTAPVPGTDPSMMMGPGGMPPGMVMGPNGMPMPQGIMR